MNVERGSSLHGARVVVRVLTQDDSYESTREEMGWLCVCEFDLMKIGEKGWVVLVI